MRILPFFAVFVAPCLCVQLPIPPSFAPSALTKQAAQKIVDIDSFSAVIELLQSLQVDTHVQVLLFKDLHGLTAQDIAYTQAFAQELQEFLRTLAELAEANPQLHNLKQRYNFHVSTLPVTFVDEAKHVDTRLAADVTESLKDVYAKYGGANTLFLFSSPMTALFTDKGRSCGVYGGIGESSYAWLSLQQSRTFRYGPSDGSEGFVDSLGSFLSAKQGAQAVDREALSGKITKTMSHWSDAGSRLSDSTPWLPPFLNNSALSNPMDAAALVFRSAQALFPQFHSFNTTATPAQQVTVLAIHLKLFEEGALHPGRRGGSLTSKRTNIDLDDDDHDDFDDELTRDMDANADIALDPSSFVEKLQTLFEPASKKAGWPSVQVELLSSLSLHQQTQLEVCVSLAVDGVAGRQSHTDTGASLPRNPIFRRIHTHILMDCAVQIFEEAAKISTPIQKSLQKQSQWGRSILTGSSSSDSNSGDVRIIPLLIVEDRSETPMMLENFKLAETLEAPIAPNIAPGSNPSVADILRRSPRIAAVYSQMNEEMNSFMTCYRSDQEKYERLPLDDRLFQIELFRASVYAVTGHKPSEFFDSISGMTKRDYLWAHPRTSPAPNGKRLDIRETQFPARASVIRQVDEVVRDVIDSLHRFQRWQIHFEDALEQTVLQKVQSELSVVLVALDDTSFQYSHNDFLRANDVVNKAKHTSQLLAAALKELSSRVHETVYPTDVRSFWEQHMYLWGVYAAYVVVGAIFGGIAIKVLEDQVACSKSTSKRRLGTFAR